jgi:hypothetical protein
MQLLYASAHMVHAMFITYVIQTCMDLKIHRGHWRGRVCTSTGTGVSVYDHGTDKNPHQPPHKQGHLEMDNSCVIKFLQTTFSAYITITNVSYLLLLSTSCTCVYLQFYVNAYAESNVY